MSRGFVMHRAGVSTGVCPICRTALAAPDSIALNAAMVAHLNFQHDTETAEEDR